MKSFGKAIAFVIALPIILLIGAFIVATAYSMFFTYTHRFRMTVEVETPNGIKTGSSVLQSSYSVSPSWVPQTGTLNSSLRGEAVFMDLGEGKNVVALLAGGAHGEQYFGADLAARALGRDRNESGVRGGWFKEAPSWTGSAELTGELKPTIVSFADPVKPETARVISPYQLDPGIGPGFHLKRVWIEMVNDSVTRTLEGQLPWVGNYAAETSAWRSIRGGVNTGASAMPNFLFRRP